MSKRTDLSLSEKIHTVLKDKCKYCKQKRATTTSGQMMMYYATMKMTLLKRTSLRQSRASTLAQRMRANIKTVTLVVKVTHVVTRPSIQILQQYFIEQGFNDAHHAALNMCANEVFAKAASKMENQSRLVCGLAMN